MKNVAKKFTYLLVLLCLIAIASGQNSPFMNDMDMEKSGNATVFTYDIWESIGLYYWNSQVYTQV